MEVFLQEHFNFLFLKPEMAFDWFLWLFVFVIWSGITINMQKTTLLAGRSMVSNETLEHSPEGYQDILTPSWQTRNSFIWFGVAALFIVITFFLMKWWAALMALLISSILISIVRKTIVPKEMSKFWLEKMFKDMVAREEEYKRLGDSSKEDALRSVIGKFENMYIN